MAAQMWMGTLYESKTPGTSSIYTNASMRWVPCPDTGMGAGAEGYSELMGFENGGADVVASGATHRVYDLDWGTRTGSGTDGLDVIRSYQQGIFGPGLIYFLDPMNFTTNLFPPHFATPSLSEWGWKPAALVGSYPNIPYLTAAPYDLPRRAFTTDLANPVAKPVQDGSKLVAIPIPPGYTLHVCFRHLVGAGNGGTIGATPVFADGQQDTNQTLTVGPLGSATTYSFSGSTYKAVEFWARGYIAGWVGSMAWLYPTGVTPPNMATARHVPGGGHTGCKFTSAAIVENYVMADRTLKGMSTQLTEVGAWQRSGT